MNLRVLFKNTLILLLFSAVLAFGLFNVHAQSNITEGGILGLSLLIEKTLSVSPAVSGAILNLLCYVAGGKRFGKIFLIYSGISAIGFSLFYAVFEWIGPVFYQIANHPLLAAVVGAMFIGVGCGVCVRVGGAPSGDDALAMTLSSVLKVRIKWVYLFFDVAVLSLSLIYIPFSKIIYSFLTVIISGQIVDFIQNYKRKAE